MENIVTMILQFVQSIVGAAGGDAEAIDILGVVSNFFQNFDIPGLIQGILTAIGK